MVTAPSTLVVKGQSPKLGKAIVLLSFSHFVGFHEETETNGAKGE